MTQPNALTLIEDADDAAIAQWLAGRIANALARQSGPVSICVPGGVTPLPILAALAHSPMDWQRITIWPGDDRIVQEDHPASNHGKLRRLLEPTGATVLQLHQDAVPPHFAFTWLGMGLDGHIASLFPDTDPAMLDAPRAIRVTPTPLPPEAPFDRISLTIPLLLNSDEIVLVIRGSEKKAIFDSAAAHRNGLPVSRLLHTAQQPITCFT